MDKDADGARGADKLGDGSAAAAAAAAAAATSLLDAASLFAYWPRGDSAAAAAAAASGGAAWWTMASHLAAQDYLARLQAVAGASAAGTLPFGGLGP
ncbi:Protein of unknown function, partial [Gryllus bimaculatus]